MLYIVKLHLIFLLLSLLQGASRDIVLQNEEENLRVGKLLQEHLILLVDSELLNLIGYLV